MACIWLFIEKILHSSKWKLLVNKENHWLEVSATKLTGN